MAASARRCERRTTPLGNPEMAMRGPSSLGPSLLVGAAHLVVAVVPLEEEPLVCPTGSRWFAQQDAVGLPNRGAIGGRSPVSLGTYTDEILGSGFPGIRDLPPERVRPSWTATWDASSRGSCPGTA